MGQTFACQGLYVVTDALLIPDERLLIAVEQALLGGAQMVQYRDKSADIARRRAQAQALNVLCQRHDAPLIINDDVELAAEVGAAGVHIGQDDPQYATARARLGAKALIGVSCYNRLGLALAAEQAGANYVAFGAFFPSPTKLTEIRASLELLREARTALTVPVIAIGGIIPENALPLLEAGADALAVISGVFGQPDIQAAAARYAALFA
ncbi:MAG: thiamine phosphate synthase [Candidatus Competibacteraceae bacterium]|nr:thiamine phosphate synthase [Candidatus Competibacteraceae bacterium]MCP5126758.1 thiamine phosphate synthase [Gammaproteobacteria bacterium]HRX71064.1 thiamine phosphate synthase [Candidatus Competibacteraceae bacterium]